MSISQTSTATQQQPVIVDGQPYCPLCLGHLIGAYSLRYYGDVSLDKTGQITSRPNSTGESEEGAIAGVERTVQGVEVSVNAVLANGGEDTTYQSNGVVPSTNGHPIVTTDADPLPPLPEMFAWRLQTLVSDLQAKGAQLEAAAEHGEETVWGWWERHFECVRDKVTILTDQVAELVTVGARSPSKEWYSTVEIAKRMEVSRYTVQERWCNAGRIECEKDPETGKWRIPASEFDRLQRGEGLRSPQLG